MIDNSYASNNSSNINSPGNPGTSIVPLYKPVSNFDEVKSIETIAQHFLTSQYFKDLRSISQAVVKILKGRELGIAPYSAVDQINIIQGKLVMNANLVASLIRKSKSYDYEILELTDKLCSIQILRYEKKLNPVISFSIEDAKRAGLTRNQTYTAYPSNMLFARAISNAARFHCPDITQGVYVPEDFPDQEVPSSYEATDLPEIKNVNAFNHEEVQDLLTATNTSLEDLNTYLGTLFKSVKDLEGQPFAINYLKTKKEAMGK